MVNDTYNRAFNNPNSPIVLTDTCFSIDYGMLLNQALAAGIINEAGFDLLTELFNEIPVNPEGEDGDTTDPGSNSAFYDRVQDLLQGFYGFIWHARAGGFISGYSGIYKWLGRFLV